MREDKISLIEAHVAGITFHNFKDALPQNRHAVLILRRSPDRKLYPNLWECGGGQVNPGENFEEAVERQLREEAGINVQVLAPIGTYEIDVPDSEQKKIPGIYFACRFVNDINGLCPQLSKEHIAHAWRVVRDLNGYEFIPGLENEIKKAHSIYSSLYP